MLSKSSCWHTETVDPFKKSKSHYSQICGKDLRFEHRICMYTVDMCSLGFDLITCCQHTQLSAEGINEHRSWSHPRVSRTQSRQVGAGVEVGLIKYNLSRILVKVLTEVCWRGFLLLLKHPGSLSVLPDVVDGPHSDLEPNLLSYPCFSCEFTSQSLNQFIFHEPFVFSSLFWCRF